MTSMLEPPTPTQFDLLSKYKVGDTLTVANATVVEESYVEPFIVAAPIGTLEGYARFLFLDCDGDLGGKVDLMMLWIGPPRLHRSTSVNGVDWLARLKRATKTKTTHALAVEIDYDPVALGQYTLKSAKGQSRNPRYMTVRIVQRLISRASVARIEGRHTIKRDRRRSLRPSETGFALRNLDLDAVFSRLGGAWATRKGGNPRKAPSHDDLPWLFHKANEFSLKQWNDKNPFEQRCIHKAARLIGHPWQTEPEAKDDLCVTYAPVALQNFDSSD